MLVYTPSIVTAREILAELAALANRLTRQLTAGEITEKELNERMEDLLMSARLKLTDEEFLEVQRGVLAMHHEITANLSAHGNRVPGNDPRRPN
jgi:hypothetical protein